jgi:preprotein translocase subunit SecF
MSLAHRLYMGDAGLNVVGHRKRWYVVTAALMLICIGSFFIRGFNFGIEFSGGNSFQVPASAGLSLERADQIVVDSGAQVVTGQRVGSSTGEASYLIRTAPIDQTVSTTIKQRLASAAGVTPEQVSDNRVSASWGGQITQKALIALAVFLALVVVYLAVRFEWRMAVAAIGALVHDLVLAAGVYSLVGFEVTPSTVIGLLTILGFSLYDTVVVFDKVQENTKGILGGSRFTYAEAANLAINQTLMRSINTSVIALLPVAGLLFIGAGLLGAGTLKDLGLVLFVGMAAGTYSSIFLATPLVVDLKEREPRYAALEHRILARRASGEDPLRRRTSVGAARAHTAAKGASAKAATGNSGAAKPATKLAGKRSTVVLDKPDPADDALGDAIDEDLVESDDDLVADDAAGGSGDVGDTSGDLAVNGADELDADRDPDDAAGRRPPAVASGPRPGSRGQQQRRRPAGRPGRPSGSKRKR